METSETKGVIFNIQHYSIHDGPGIRTTVFLKGCPLRCSWCQNPESQNMNPVLFFNQEICTGCGACLPICPQKAASMIEGKSVTDRKLCVGCGECVRVCPNEARTIMGKETTAKEVFADVNEDAIFYRDSGGGVTISGGDPVAQPEFTISIAKLCREAGIHVAIETCGHAKWEIISQISKNADLILYDFKHMDKEKHRLFTGVDNRQVLDNARRIYHELKRPLTARIPVVPGHNASEENIRQTAEFIAKELGKDVRVHLLPYHRLGTTKYARMEAFHKAINIEPPADEDMKKFKTIIEKHGLQVEIGG